MATQPSKARLRSLLRRMLRSDAELNAFCLDFFESAHSEFTGSMTQTDKITLLLRHADTKEIINRITERFSERLSDGDLSALYEEEAVRRSDVFDINTNRDRYPGKIRCKHIAQIAMLGYIVIKYAVDKLSEMVVWIKEGLFGASTAANTAALAKSASAATSIIAVSSATATVCLGIGWLVYEHRRPAHQQLQTPTETSDRFNNRNGPNAQAPTQIIPSLTNNPTTPTKKKPPNQRSQVVDLASLDLHSRVCYPEAAIVKKISDISRGAVHEIINYYEFLEFQKRLGLHIPEQIPSHVLKNGWVLDRYRSCSEFTDYCRSINNQITGYCYYQIRDSKKFVSVCSCRR